MCSMQELHKARALQYFSIHTTETPTTALLHHSSYLKLHIFSQPHPERTESITEIITPTRKWYLSPLHYFLSLLSENLKDTQSMWEVFDVLKEGRLVNAIQRVGDRGSTLHHSPTAGRSNPPRIQSQLLPSGTPSNMHSWISLIIDTNAQAFCSSSLPFSPSPR